MQGDFDVVARVASLAEGANAGVMIRESLAADSRHVALLVSESDGYAFDRRTETGVPAERTDGGPAGIPAWVKLVRRGPQVEVFRSDDGAGVDVHRDRAIAASGEVYVGTCGERRRRRRRGEGRARPGEHRTRQHPRPPALTC